MQRVGCTHGKDAQRMRAVVGAFPLLPHMGASVLVTDGGTACEGCTHEESINPGTRGYDIHLRVVACIAMLLYWIGILHEGGDDHVPSRHV